MTALSRTSIQSLCCSARTAPTRRIRESRREDAHRLCPTARRSEPPEIVHTREIVPMNEYASQPGGRHDQPDARVPDRR